MGLLALAVAFLIVHLGGTWHLAREQHVRCAEHGEWIDVAARHVHSGPADHRGPVVHGTDAAQAGHEHCELVLASRLRAIVWNVDTLDRAPEPSIVSLPAPREAPVDRGFALYLLAPKQSPPC